MVPRAERERLKAAYWVALKAAFDSALAYRSIR